jgi:tRNA(Ile)-lysidine synthase
VATLKKAKITFADDPTNRDASFTRPRLRAIMPALAAEGCDARNLARLASRLARANAALELLVDGAERYLALGERDPTGFDARAFAALSEEIRLRLLLRRIDRIGHEGPAELGKVEALVAALDRASAAIAFALNRRRRAAARAPEPLTTAGKQPFRRHYLNRNAANMR